MVDAGGREQSLRFSFSLEEVSTRIDEGLRRARSIAVCAGWLCFFLVLA